MAASVCVCRGRNPTRSSGRSPFPLIHPVRRIADRRRRPRNQTAFSAVDRVHRGRGRVVVGHTSCLCCVPADDWLMSDADLRVRHVCISTLMPHWPSTTSSRLDLSCARPVDLRRVSTFMLIVIGLDENHEFAESEKRWIWSVVNFAVCRYFSRVLHFSVEIHHLVIPVTEKKHKFLV